MSVRGPLRLCRARTRRALVFGSRVEGGGGVNGSECDCTCVRARLRVRALARGGVWVGARAGPSRSTGVRRRGPDGRPGDAWGAECGRTDARACACVRKGCGGAPPRPEPTAPNRPSAGPVPRRSSQVPRRARTEGTRRRGAPPWTEGEPRSCACQPQLVC